MRASMHSALGQLYDSSQQRHTIGAWTARALIKRGFATEDGDTISITELGRSAAESGVSGWIRKHRSRATGGMILTSVTITDEQILELREHAAARLNASDFGHGDEDTVVACDRALRLDSMDDEAEDERQALFETSRARCAELLNARSKEST